VAQKFTVPITVKQLTSASSDAVTVYVDADTYARLKVEAGGRLVWGGGSATGDVNLYRDSADVLKTDDTFKTAGLYVTGTQIDPTGATTGDALVFNGTKFVSASVAGGGATLTVSDTPPTVDITEGDLWFESDTGKTFVYYDSFWVEVGSGGSIESGVATQSDWNQTNISAADYIENKPNVYNTGDDLYLDPQGTGLVYITGDMIPLSSSVSLGSSASPYNEVWVGPSSLKILSQDGGPTITLSNQEDFLRVQSGGLIVESTASVSTGGILRVDPEGQLFITSSYQNPNKSSVLTIVGNNVGTFSPPVNNGGMVHITGHDNLTSRIVNDSYGNSVFSQMAGRHAAGTSASPTAARTGPLFRITGAGWRPGAGFGIAGDDPPVFLDFYAKEDFEANDTPTEIRFYTTPSGQYKGVLSTVIDSSGIQLEQSGSGITFYDNTVQTTAYKGSSTFSGYYGSFYDTTNLLMTSATTAYALPLNTTAEAVGVSIVSGSRITVANAGVYNIQFSAQLNKTDSNDDLVNIWFAKNGTNITNSNTQVTVLGNGGKFLASWNFVLTLAANDYVQIMLQSPDTNMRVIASGEQSSPARPAVPSSIVTVTQVR